MEWDIISKNPKFISAIGTYVYGDPQEWWNRLKPETQQQLAAEYGTQTPALNQEEQPEVAPVMNPNDGFERVMVGSGLNLGSVMYNPATGEVKAVEGDPVSQLYMQNSNIQNMAKDKYNQSVNAPVLEATKNLETMNNIVNAQEGDVDGAILNQYTDARNNVTEQQRAALSQMSNPSAVDMAVNRPSYTTPVLTGLEQFEVDNPLLKTKPVENNVALGLPVEGGPATGINTQITPNNVVAPPPVLGMNEEAGRGNMYDTYRSPVLVDTTQPNTGTSTGVLETTDGPSVRSIMSSSGPKTSNMRGSMMPEMLIDRNEALIRIGGRMYGGALQGDGISAATDEYGKIQDANRATAMEKYKTDQAQKLAMAKAAAKGKGTDTKTLTGMTAQMDSYQRALQAIADSRAAGGNLTGVGGMFKSLLDNFTGDEDGARRLILSKVKVDDALMRVAHTKGAISNAEMKLFLSPAPKNWQDEKIWESWLNERVDALRTVQNRLATGQKVPPEMASASVEATKASIATEPDAQGFSIKEVTPK